MIAESTVRLERDQVFDREQMTLAIGRLDGLAASWREIQPGEPMRRTASRLLRTHSLRAADAFQLAAARAASEDRPETLPFVTLDDRLALAAQREGFDVIQPIT
jgi:predicted nucleic acid-binding protein